MFIRHIHLFAAYSVYFPSLNQEAYIRRHPGGRRHISYRKPDYRRQSKLTPSFFTRFLIYRLSPIMAETDNEWLWLEIVTIIVIATGILSNGIVLIVFFAKSSRKLRRKWRNLYILHQSIIDGSCLFGLLLLRSIKIDDDVFKENTIAVRILCKFWVSEYLLWSMYMCSTYNLVLLSIERYLAVVYPIYHRTKLNKKKILLSMILPWIIGFAFQSYWPPMYTHDSNNGSCLPSYSCNEGRPSTLQTFLTVYSFIGEYIIALLIMSFAYSQIVIKLKLIIKRTSKNINLVKNGRKKSDTAACYEVNSNANEKKSVFTLTGTRSMSNDNESKNRSNHRQRSIKSRQKSRDDIFSKAKRSTVRTFIAIFVLFVICWTPTEVVYLRHNLCIEELDFDGTLYAWLSLLVVLNAVLNPFIYTGLYNEFQRQLRRVFCNWDDHGREPSNSVGEETSNAGNSTRGRAPDNLQLSHRPSNNNI